MGRSKTALMDLSCLSPGDPVHKELEELSWPTPYSSYASISESLIDKVLSLLTNTQNNETTCAILRAKSYDIVCDLSLLLRLSIDVAGAKKAGTCLLYSQEASPLLTFLDVGTDAYSFPIPRIWHHPIDRSIKKRSTNLARRFLSHLRSHKAGGERVDVHNRNNLVDDYLSASLTSHVDWPVANIDWHYSATLPKALAEIVSDFCESISGSVRSQISEKDIEAKFHKLAHRLISFHLAKAYTDFHILKRQIRARPSAAILLSGTPKHLGRLASWLYLQKGGTTIRCAHGGERAFFIDSEWGLAEFPDCDTYYTHGKAERDALDRRIRHNIIPTANSEKSISFKSVGSSHHQQIYNHSKIKRPSSPTGEILYVAGGYLGESFGDFTSRKPPDPLYLDYQVDLLRKLKQLGYRVILKSHPGGVISNKRFLARYSDQVLNGFFDPTTSTADCFIFDFAGTAFVDALASGRPMVLADMGIRPFDDTVYADLSFRCPIIPAGVNEEGRFRVQTEDLGSAIVRSMETEPMAFVDFHRKFFAA